MLLIDDADIRKLLSMEDCIDAMEEAFREFASGIAVNRPRVRYSVPPSGAATIPYKANIIVGAVPGFGTACVRIDSILSGEQVAYGLKRFDRVQPAKRNWGLILLYGLETGEPLAMIHDFTISGIRVGATSALGVKCLAREDAQILGLFGTGKQAREHLRGIAQVRRLKEIRVYSPSEEHRKTFCNEMGEALGLKVRPVNDSRTVVEGADVVCCTTNSIEPVFNGEWLTKGQLVITIENSDVTHRKSEADETTFIASDFIVVNDKESVFANNQFELLEPIDKGRFTWDKVRQLGDIIIGSSKGRTNPKELVYFKNNTGMGIQFAAAGAIVYREACKKGVGREFPTEWFGTNMSEWYEKGYYPSA